MPDEIIPVTGYIVMYFAGTDHIEPHFIFKAQFIVTLQPYFLFEGSLRQGADRSKFGAGPDLVHVFNGIRIRCSFCTVGSLCVHQVHIRQAVQGVVKIGLCSVGNCIYIKPFVNVGISEMNRVGGVFLLVFCVEELPFLNTFISCREGFDELRSRIYGSIFI